MLRNLHSVLLISGLLTPTLVLGQTETKTAQDNADLIAQAYSPEILAARRQRLLDSLPPGSVVIVTAAKAPREDYDPYRQSPSFLYLTGLERGPGRLLMSKDGTGIKRTALYLAPLDIRRELWEGPRPSVKRERARGSRYDELAELPAFEAALAQALTGAQHLYLSGFESSESKVLRPDNLAVKSLGPELAELRLVKEPGELALLQRAIDITCAAQIEAMRSIRPGQFEFEVQATIEYVFRRYGAEQNAFQSICGCGPNSCVLHYNANRRRMQPGELIVVDVGARLGGYCADVTRTFPVSGRFTPRQREIYNIVLEAQRAGFAAVKPGATLGDVHQAASAVIAKAGYRRYFPHGTSHWLGLETHDVLDARRDTKLRPGMVLTVEPGIYIPEEELGVRIEDDVVVTADGYRILSDGVPRSAEEVEALCQSMPGVGAKPVAGLPSRDPAAKPPAAKPPAVSPDKPRIY